MIMVIFEKDGQTNPVSAIWALETMGIRFRIFSRSRYGVFAGNWITEMAHIVRNAAAEVFERNVHRLMKWSVVTSGHVCVCFMARNRARVTVSIQKKPRD